MDNDTSLTDFYDYSVHRHCVTFGFDEKGAHAGIFFTSKSSGDSPDNGPRRRCCILYNVATKEILERDYDTANEMILKNKDPNVFYVDNIFMRLYGIYQKKEKDNHDEIILHAVGVFMRKLVDEYQSNLSCERESYMPFHFGFLVPTHWDHAIRTEIIRPLFVQTKLINKDDDDRRLLFLTRLESAMTDIQHSEKKMVERKNIEMVHGKKYILYDLKFDEEDLNVGLDLFSTHQPPPSSVYPYFETKILQTLIVKIPLNSDMEHGIEECLKKRNFGFKTTRSIEILNALVNHYKHHKFIFSEKDKDEYVYQEKQLYKYQPFKALFDKDNKPEATLLIKKCDLTQEEIESIQSITTKEIHKDLFTSAEKAIVSSVERLKRYEDSRIRTGIFSVLDMPLFSSYNLRFNDEFHVYASWLLFTWLKDFFKEHGVSELKSQFVENRDSNLRYQIKLEDMMKGFQTQIQWKVRVSHMNTPPAIKERPAIKNWEEAAQLSLFPKSTILRYAIEIAISPQVTQFLCSTLDEKGYVEETTGYKDCSIFNLNRKIRPLEDFVIYTEMYQCPLLRISKRMLNYMENNFDDIIDDFLYGDRKPTKDMITRAGLKFRDCFKKGEMDTFFTENSKDMDVISLRQSKEFSHLFMLMYLCYVKKVVSDELEELLKFKWKEVNVGFVMCIQKTVLDSMNISKHELLHELPAIDSIFEETTEKSKLRIMTQGEVVSPAIQQNLKLPLKIKSYFVLAQIYENYVQLTLQHVVKDADSKSEYVSAIVVEDKIVPIANVNDKLHENIWRHLIKVHCKTNHTNKKDDTVCDIFATEKYKEALKMLKPLVSKIFGTTFSRLDLDESITVEICNHNYYLTLRRVIEVCMRPILQNIANVISSSLDNIDLFKNYPVTNVFIMGNVFNIIEGSSLYPAVTLLLQQIFDENIMYKERDTLGFVMKESLLQLLHPVIGKRLHLLDSFVLGDLQQISRESYGIYLKPIYSLNNHTSETLLSCINRKGGVTRVFGEDYATVILLKGQSIPITGITVRFEASNIDKKVNAYMLLIGMVKVSTDTLDQRKAGSFDKRTFDIIDVLRTPISDRGTLIPPVTLEIRYVNHVSSLQFSMRLTGEDKPKDVVHMVSVEEKLTVTYL